jgi:hypothetical protein
MGSSLQQQPDVASLTSLVVLLSVSVIALRILEVRELKAGTHKRALMQRPSTEPSGKVTP